MEGGASPESGPEVDQAPCAQADQWIPRMNHSLEAGVRAAGMLGRLRGRPGEGLGDIPANPPN